MKLNCDLGESFTAWKKGDDSAIMPLIDMANIACGFHAGDPLTMVQTIALAKQHNVSIGAHPSYQDLHGFGRRSIAYSPDELIAIIQYQISAIAGLCRSQQVHIDYVKPHGALYNDMMKDLAIFTTICQAIEHINLQTSSNKPLPLMVQALPDAPPHENNSRAIKAIAKQHNIPLLFEAFADRNYENNGLLTPRSQPNAMLTSIGDLRQRCRQLIDEQSITSVHGEKICMTVDTLCIHGDHDGAALTAAELRNIIASVS